MTCHLVEDPWKEGWQWKCQSLSYVWLCNLMNCSPPGSSVHGIFQARTLEWVAIPFSKDLADPGIKPRSPSLQVDSLLSEPPDKRGEIVVLLRTLKLGWGRAQLGCHVPGSWYSDCSINMHSTYAGKDEWNIRDMCEILAVMKTKKNCLLCPKFGERIRVPACQSRNSKKGPNNNSNSNNREDTHVFTLEHCWDHRDSARAGGDPGGFASGLPWAPLRAQLLPVRNSPLPQYGPHTSFLATMWETKSSEFSKIVLKDKTILPGDWRGERKVKGVKQKSRQRQEKKTEKTFSLFKLPLFITSADLFSLQLSE